MRDNVNWYLSDIILIILESFGHYEYMAKETSFEQQLSIA
jgi:hypothetical protein